jgi:hypothetical protein
VRCGKRDEIYEPQVNAKSTDDAVKTGTFDCILTVLRDTFLNRRFWSVGPQEVQKNRFDGLGKDSMFRAIAERGTIPPTFNSSFGYLRIHAGAVLRARAEMMA